MPSGTGFCPATRLSSSAWRKRPPPEPRLISDGRRKTAMVSVGSGDYAYDVVADWGKLPDGFEWGLLGAVAVDADDRVYVFSRGDHPLMVFERDGTYLHTIGEGVFRDGHGMCFDADGNILL